MFLKSQDFGEEMQKGSAECLFLARLVAGETAMDVVQLVPFRSFPQTQDAVSCNGGWRQQQGKGWGTGRKPCHR